jgi:nucleoside 2-deoxyribosyltransferase
MATKIYLGGPDVFLFDAHRVGEQKKAMCREVGFEGLFPFDQDGDIGPDPATIFRANCLLMHQADVGLFNLTPFRGPSADLGTIFELGFIFASGKPVYGYTSATAIYRDRVAGARGPLVEQNSVLRDRDGYEVENFGLRDNLMIVGAIEDSGGALVAIMENAVELTSATLAAFQAFRACLQLITERIGQDGIHKRTLREG